MRDGYLAKHLAKSDWCNHAQMSMKYIILSLPTIPDAIVNWFLCDALSLSVILEI